jgi:hypothetical protein
MNSMTARIGVGAELGDLAVVDVARQLGRVLVLLVLRLEGADADAVLLGEDQAPHADVLHHLGPVALVVTHELAEDLAAGRVGVTLDVDGVLLAAEAQVAEGADAPLERDQPERLLVHRAGEAVAVAGDRLQLLRQEPLEAVEGALGGAAVLFDAALDEAGDRRLGRPDGPVQQDDAPLGAVARGRALEDVDEPHERDVEPEEGVLAAVLLVLEEVVADDPLLVVDVLLLAVRQDHVVHALVGGPGDLGVLPDDLEVVLERAFPVELLVFTEVLEGGDLGDH